jgi:hypothetical protein
MARPVVAAHYPTSEGRSWIRLAPAALFSIAVHVVLIAAFMVLAPRTSADSAVQVVDPDDTPLHAVPIDDAPKAGFLTPDYNEFSTEPDVGNNNMSDRFADMTIHGAVVRPDLGLGSGTGNRSPETLPPLLGMPGSGADSGSKIRGEGNAQFGLGYGMPNGHAGIDLSQRGSAATREKAIRVNGGTTATEAAVTRGLRWLVRHQGADGAWRLDGSFANPGKVDNKTAGTALALLPFLGAGKTHKPGTKETNPYDKPVERGLLYLLRMQDKRSGYLGGGMYAHGLATIALCEAYALTQDPMLRRPAQKAVQYIVLSQHDAGGWRYQPGEAGDLSVSGWQIMALKSGMMAGLDVPAITLRKAQRYLEMTAASDEGYCYVGSESPTPTMTAVGLLCRQYLQSWGPQNLRMIKSIDKHIRPNPPESTNNVYYTYYATQVMFHFGGEGWTRWNESMRAHLVKSQDDGANDGSWAPRPGDPWTAQGGRLMSTSLNLLTLEVYYRYLPLYQRQAAAKSDS